MTYRGMTMMAWVAAAGMAVSVQAAPIQAAGGALLARTSRADAPARPRSCTVEIGAIAAGSRAATCRAVSPATRPPCNAANSCAMIEDEIARSCALFDGRGAPMRGCATAPASAAVAAAVVRRYYSAIDARDYDTAWAQWGDGGQPGRTRRQFVAGFAKTRSARVTIGRLERGDAGAGSLYQPVPVTVDTVLRNGTRQRFRGSYVVRRVNDVDGATPGQRRWHLSAARLTAVPVR